MTKIIFVRHGQTEWNLVGKYQGQSNIALSEKGLFQAKALAANFPVKKIDAVYSSDLQRAYKTASYIAAEFQLTVTTEEKLRELNFGLWEGKTYAEIKQNWPEIFSTFFTFPDTSTIPEGENFVILQKRAMAAVKEIIAKHIGQTVVVVAHGAILRTILAEALHIPLRYIWSIRQDNTAVNIICYDEESSIVELMNSTAHLNVF